MGAKNLCMSVTEKYEVQSGCVSSVTQLYENDSSVGMELGYGIRFPAEARNFSLHH
jgi:hypothetical protein